MYLWELERVQDSAWWEPEPLVIKTTVRLPSETVWGNEIIISTTLRNLWFAKISEVNVVCIFRFTTNYKAIIRAYLSSLSFVLWYVFLPPSLSLNGFPKGNKFCIQSDGWFYGILLIPYMTEDSHSELCFRDIQSLGITTQWKEEMTDLWQWSTFLDQCDYIRMLNLDILICLWECFVSHKSHRNIFKELPQKATAFLLSKEKQSQGVICQSFKQNGPFMNWHWMVSYSDIHRILKQRCILWLTSAYRSKELYFSLLTYFGSLNF